MWNPWSWSRSSNEVAVANARAASLDCSLRRVERVEVELYVHRRLQELSAAQHPA